MKPCRPIVFRYFSHMLLLIEPMEKPSENGFDLHGIHANISYANLTGLTSKGSEGSTASDDSLPMDNVPQFSIASEDDSGPGAGSPGLDVGPKDSPDTPGGHEESTQEDAATEDDVDEDVFMKTPGTVNSSGASTPRFPMRFTIDSETPSRPGTPQLVSPGPSKGQITPEALQMALRTSTDNKIPRYRVSPPSPRGDARINRNGLPSPRIPRPQVCWTAKSMDEGQGDSDPTRTQDNLTPEFAFRLQVDDKSQSPENTTPDSRLNLPSKTVASKVLLFESLCTKERKSALESEHTTTNLPDIQVNKSRKTSCDSYFIRPANKGCQSETARSDDDCIDFVRTPIDGEPEETLDDSEQSESGQLDKARHDCKTTHLSNAEVLF